MTGEIKHHPDDANLVSYAAGTLTEALTAIVASHVAMCPRCRDEVSDLELLGATLLSQAQCSSKALSISHGAGTKTFGNTRPDVAPLGLPAPIARAYGLSSAEIPWKRLAPGVWHYRLPLSPGETGDLRLLKIGPGRKMPTHGHGGPELTLVIDGAYSDATGTYRRGDIQDVDEGIEHQPVVDMGGTCICIIASEQPARFKSFFGRLLQPWTGL